VSYPFAIDKNEHDLPKSLYRAKYLCYGIEKHVSVCYNKAKRFSRQRTSLFFKGRAASRCPVLLLRRSFSVKRNVPQIFSAESGKSLHDLFLSSAALRSLSAAKTVA
ncbi:MAG: hypothetical protein IIY79_02105, partial [Ruminococcus sp.]|nr:hypothetical protein [Ruminococcus sp.]